MNLPQLANLHRSIAADVWPNGAVLKCTVCSHTESISSEQAAGFLRRAALDPAEGA